MRPDSQVFNTFTRTVTHIGAQDRTETEKNSQSTVNGGEAVNGLSNCRAWPH
jgi:hypothetical protein